MKSKLLYITYNILYPWSFPTLWPHLGPFSFFVTIGLSYTSVSGQVLLLLGFLHLTASSRKFPLHSSPQLLLIPWVSSFCGCWAHPSEQSPYRAHGHINLSMSSPCCIEMILVRKEHIVSKLEEEVAQKKNTSENWKWRKHKLIIWK